VLLLLSHFHGTGYTLRTAAGSITGPGDSEAGTPGLQWRAGKGRIVAAAGVRSPVL
jgi:hypothetical protein